MNEVMRTLLTHRSVRSYERREIADEILEAIARAVQAAPNWVNLQHVSIVEVRDQQRRLKLAKLCGEQPYIAEAPVFWVFCADFHRSVQAALKSGADISAAVQHPDNLLVAAHECGIALGTAVAAAASYGLGSVPIGDVRLNPLAVIEELKLPKFVIPMLGLCLGFPAENPPLKPRLPLEAVYFAEHYPSDLQAELQAYDEEYARYLINRPWNSRVGDWSSLNADFYRAPYSHYPEIAKALAVQGFYDFLRAKEAHHAQD